MWLNPSVDSLYSERLPPYHPRIVEPQCLRPSLGHILVHWTNDELWLSVPALAVYGNKSELARLATSSTRLPQELGVGPHLCTLPAAELKCVSLNTACFASQPSAKRAGELHNFVINSRCQACWSQGFCLNWYHLHLLKLALKLWNYKHMYMICTKHMTFFLPQAFWGQLPIWCWSLLL